MQKMWQIKEMIALAMLAVCAYTDIKERSIYVFPLVVSVTGAVAISTVSFMCAPVDKETEILLYDILLPAITGGILIVAVRAAKSHMGMGDGWLMASLGMTIGVRDNIIAVTAAFLAASVYACIILFGNGIRRRLRHKSIPFAPFVMAGYMLVLVNGI